MGSIRAPARSAALPVGMSIGIVVLLALGGIPFDASPPGLSPGAHTTTNVGAATPLAPGIGSIERAGASGAVPSLQAISNDVDRGAATSPLASLIEGLPASTRAAPWLQSLAHEGPSLQPLESLPNLALLEHPAQTIAGSIDPGYAAQPAPLGIADYGLGGTTYSYNTSHLLGAVTLYAPPNVTDPASTSATVPGASHLGFVGSLNEFGVQLNTVATNISIPGSDSAFFWTQNVVDWNSTGIHFLSDTFNFSSPFLELNRGTIYSGCDNDTAGVNEILSVYGGVFQCVGGTLPVSPASYPVTLDLYNNATVNAQNRTQIAFGYRLVEAGTGAVYTGVTDTVVFNNPSAPAAAPANRPGFSIDGFAPAPVGLLRDAELDFVGDIGGDNAVFRSFNATAALEYSNSSSGGYRSVPSAYNFGSDTGETSTGLADYWTPAHTLDIHQGPAMLYGLWNAVPRVSVASGAVHLEGTIAPSYGFVFVSNTPPAPDPWATGAPAENMSWLPTAPDGRFNTYLPPLGAPWTREYYVEGLAAGSQTITGAPIVGNQTDYSLALVPAPGTFDAPLYMFSNDQAASLSRNVSGSAGPPYEFGPLRDSVNFTFDHLNDYGYPSFELLLSEGVTQPVVVNATVEGRDSGLGNFYFLDYSSSRSLLQSPPVQTGSRLNFTSEIEIFGGFDDEVVHQSLSTEGSGIVLWQDVDAAVHGIRSNSGSAGVWIGDSVGTTVVGVEASVSIGVQDIDSRGTHGQDITAYGAAAVELYGSTDATFADLSVSDYDIGVVTGLYEGPLGSPLGYYDVVGSIGLNVSGITAGFGSLAALIETSQDVAVANVTVTGYLGIVVDGSSGSVVRQLSATDAVVAVELLDATATALTQISAFRDDTGVAVLENSTGTVVTHSEFVADSGYGVVILNSTGSTVDRNLFFDDHGAGFTYSAQHIQAYTAADNDFDSAENVGNYWSDWHTYSGGRLAPYPISNGVADEYPLASIGGLYPLVFSETGLPATRARWSAALDGSLSRSVDGAGGRTSQSLTLLVPNGSYSYVLAGPAGWQVAGAGGPAGSVTVAGFGPVVDVTFEKGRTANVRVSESGLRPRSLWCVTLGWERCSTSPTIEFRNLTPSLYELELSPVGGAVTLVKPGDAWVTTDELELAIERSTILAVRYAYPVTFYGWDLPASLVWSVTSQGITQFSDSNGLIYLNLTNGTDRFSVHPPAGYRSSPSSGKVRVDGSFAIVEIVFRPD